MKTLLKEDPKLAAFIASYKEGQNAEQNAEIEIATGAGSLLDVRKKKGMMKPAVEGPAVFNTMSGERFIEAFMVTRERKLLKLFISDLFTEKEISQFVRRFEGAYWLSLGMPYEKIQETTGLSPTIIARLNKKFIDKKGGFSQVMRKIYPRGAVHFEKTEFVDRCL